MADHHRIGRAFGLETLEPRALLAAVSWDGGGGDTLWSNPLNWSGNALPGVSDDVTIALGAPQRTIVLDVGPTKVRSLALDETLVVNSGRVLSVTGDFDLGVNADLRINGVVNWASGDWRTTKTARVQPGGLLNIGSASNPTAGAVTLESALVNDGRVAWRGGQIRTKPGGAITNNAGKLMDFSSPGSIDSALDENLGDIVILNQGLLRRGGGADTTTAIIVDLVNTGRINILRGTLKLTHTSGFMHDERFEKFENSGTVAVLSATSTLAIQVPSVQDGARFIGPGIVEFSRISPAGGGTVYASDVYFGAAQVSHVLDAAVHVSADGARFTGELSIAAFQVWIDGPLLIDGQLDIDFSSGFGDAPGIFGVSEIEVAGALRLIGSVPPSAFSPPPTMAVRPHVLPGGMLEIGRVGEPDLVVGIQAGLEVEGEASLVAGECRILLNSLIDVMPGGRFTVEAGASGITGGRIAVDGTLVVESGEGPGITSRVTNRGVLETARDLTLASPQLARIAQTGDVAALAAGTWVVRGCELRLADPDDAEQYAIAVIKPIASVRLLGAGAMLRNLRGFFTGGLNTGFGLTELRGRLTLGDGLATLNTVPEGGTLLNFGTLERVGTGTTVLGMSVTQRKTPLLTPVIRVQAGTLEIPGTSFANTGTLDVLGTLTIDLNGGAFTNTGSIQLGQAGRLSIDGAIETSGTITTVVTALNYGRIITTGALTISGGPLVATFVGGGFAAGQNRTIATGSLRTGTFASVSASGLAGGLSATGVYGNFSMVLRVTAI